MLALVLAVGLSLLLVGHSARGQAPSQAAPTASPGTSPTAVPTATLPSARDLVNKAVAANRRRGTVHYVAASKIVRPARLRIVQQVVGDLSFVPLAEKERITERDTQLDTNPQITNVIRSQSVVVGNAIAMRTGRQAWQCQSFAGTQQAIDDLTGALSSANVVLVVAGSGTVGGAPVWHVRASLNLPGSAQPLIEDLFISRSDYTFRMESFSATLSVGGQMVRETVTERFSKYGEKLHIALPATCKTGKEDLSK